MTLKTKDGRDKAIGPKGRPVGRPVGSKSERSLRQTKLKQLLEMLDPLTRKAIAKASAILEVSLENEKVSPTVQLSAAKLVIDLQVKLREEVYKKESKEMADIPDIEDDEQRGAVLSFVVPSKD